jgi:hypothetical protein
MLSWNEKYPLFRQQYRKILTIVNSYNVQSIHPGIWLPDCPGKYQGKYQKGLPETTMPDTDRSNSMVIIGGSRSVMDIQQFQSGVL